MKRRFGFGLLVVVILLATQFSSAFATDNSAYVVNQDHSKYVTWGDQFWQWALTSPSVHEFNKIFSPNGKCYQTNQNYEVFFLVGSLGPGTAKRTCEVKAGTTLFFPLINQPWGENPRFYDATADPPYIPTTFIHWFDEIFSPTNGVTVFATLDGTPLITKTTQDWFYVASSPTKAPTYLWVIWPLMEYQTFNGGYYVALQLPARDKPYTLHFGGDVPNPPTFVTTFRPGSEWVKAGETDPDNFPNPYKVPFLSNHQDITYSITVTK